MNDNSNKEPEITALIDKRENIFDKIANFLEKYLKEIMKNKLSVLLNLLKAIK